MWGKVRMYSSTSKYAPHTHTHTHCSDLFSSRIVSVAAVCVAYSGSRFFAFTSPCTTQVGLISQRQVEQPWQSASREVGRISPLTLLINAAFPEPPPESRMDPAVACGTESREKSGFSVSWYMVRTILTGTRSTCVQSKLMFNLTFIHPITTP